MRQAGLIVDTPESNADLVYATGFFAPDPVIYLEHAGRKTLVLNRLEIDRGKREARVDEILPLEDFAAILRKSLKREPGTGEIVLALLRSKKIRQVRVPQNFGLTLARVLEKGGILVSTSDGVFYPQREFKSKQEVRHLQKALRITEAGMRRGMDVLRASTPDRRNYLHWAGTHLTSERLRAEIDSAILYQGGLPQNTIVAGGRQACDPHERGHGKLRAGELIILDIFPRSVSTGYFGDMTRTVIRGKANENQRRLWHTVQQAQKSAFKQMRPGVNGKQLEDEIRAIFSTEGYPTENSQGHWTGFFHGTGHGLGLEIHEEPRFSKTVFQSGQVITVEPGLYYPGLGGVRIEDVALITDKGARCLSRFEQELEI